MAYRVEDICRVMDAWAPPGLAYDWDRAGLHTGAPDQPVAKVLTCLTVNAGAVAAAGRAGADMIVAHHPLIWEPLTHLRADDPVAALCLRIAGAGIACYSAHTNLDVAPGGVNHLLADALGLEEIGPLVVPPQAGQWKLVTFVPESHLAAVRDAVCAAGAGEIGDYVWCSFSSPGTGTFLPGASAQPFSGRRGALSEEAERRFEVLLPKVRAGAVVAALRAAHPYEEVAYDLVPLEGRDSRFSLGLRGALPKPVALRDFAAAVCESLDLDHARFVGDPRRKVRNVAVMGGAGAGEIPRIPAGVDVYVTGDVKYHEADAALARGLAVVDAGHAGTEKAVATAMAAHLKRALKGLSVKPYVEPEIFNLVARHGR